MPRAVPTRRCAVPIVLCVLVALLQGCAPATISGRVIEGEVAFVAVVESGDPRLSEPGLAGVKVEASVPRGQAQGGVFARADSKRDGAFSIPVKNAGMLKYPIEISAKSDGYLPTRNQLMVPASGRKVLVILKRGVKPGS